MVSSEKCMANTTAPIQNQLTTFTQTASMFISGVAACLALLLLLAPFHTAHAQTSSNLIQIAPAFQEIVIDDTQASVSATLQLSNSSQIDQTFQFYPLEIKQFDAEGRVVLADKPLNNNDYSIASFVTFSESEWVVPAGQSVTVPFTITNAPRLSPGGHYAALIARLKTNSADRQQVLPAISSFVLIRKVGGELYHLSLSSVSLADRLIHWSLPKQIPLTFSNQGNIHVVPRGTVTLTDLFGRVVYEGAINLESLFVFPGSQRTLQASLKPVAFAWPIMWYNGTITARSEPGNVPVSRSFQVLVIEPWISIGLTAIVICSIVLTWKRHHRVPKNKT